MKKVRKLENILIHINGILTVFTFVLFVLTGGIFNSLQNFLFRELSFIISPYYPLQDLTVPIFIFYNIFLFLFAILLGLRLRNRFAKFASLSLVLSSIIGIVLISFPMDPNRDPTTVVGFTHNVIVTSMSLYIILSLALFSYAFKKTRNLTSLAKYSLIITLIVGFFGLFTGLSAMLGLSRFVGILERVPFASFIIWIAKTSQGILKSDKRIKNY